MRKVDSGGEARELSDQLVASLKRILSTTKLIGEAGFLQFLSAYLHGLNPEELYGISDAHLAAAVVAQWRCAKGIGVGKTYRIEVFGSREKRDSFTSQPSSVDFAPTTISIVTIDLPYLVDSFTEIARDLGYVASLTLHPLVNWPILADPAESEDEGCVYSCFFLESEEELNDEGRMELYQRLEESYAHLSSYTRSIDEMKVLLERCAQDCLESYMGVTNPTEQLGISNFLPFGYLGSGNTGLEGAELGGILRLDDALVKELDGSTGVEVLAMPTWMVSSGVLMSRAKIIRVTPYRFLRFHDMRSNVSHTFLGIFLPASIALPPGDVIPLRAKVESIVSRLAMSPTSYAYRSTMSFLESLSPDELLNLSADTLTELVSVALSVEELPRLRVFFSAGDSVTALNRIWVEMPSNRYRSEVGEEVSILLRRILGAQLVALCSSAVEIRRTHLSYLLDGPGASPALIAELEAELEAITLPWKERLRTTLIARLGVSHGAELYGRFNSSFEHSYADDYSPDQGVEDLLCFERMVEEGRELDVRLAEVTSPSGLTRGLRLKLLKSGPWMRLSDILPIVEHFDLAVIDELPYSFNLDGKEAWILDIGLELTTRLSPIRPLPSREDLERVKRTMVAVWSGWGEDDELNALCLSAGLEYEMLDILRSYCAYMRLGQLGYSQSYITSAVVENPVIAAALTKYFMARFDPMGESDGRVRLLSALARDLNTLFVEVAALDQDKILRRIWTMIDATVRTNFFSPSRVGMVVKFDPSKVLDLPKPLPAHEIYFRSKRTEGVHLRGGAVARGGIRYSDRSEDFRSEILGLMKAQSVKNAVIVPVGAKGGFIVRDPPLDKSQEFTNVAECYEEFMEALISVTDNVIGHSVVHPASVLCYDSDDPYLVVAADKGTASFSDLANEISKRHHYWLGDAFASGGSTGYDHKAMGITAKGAWRSVVHHFASLSKDPTIDLVSVVGIGDMSGDVFGNGMLQSDKIRLVAAFDHRHIFIDPDPDSKESFRERKRIYELAQSSWADYSVSIISDGGGVYERRAKQIELTPQAAVALGVSSGLYEPDAVVSAILRAPVDMLWNGGVGTFVKASSESHGEVGDHRDDSVRVNASELRVKVIGEGGNLGLTQLARVEFALLGGRCNTDAIDNSAGVDTSDHEVNLKILLSPLLMRAEISNVERDLLLEGVCHEVEDQVLADNTAQNWVLSISEFDASRNPISYQNLQSYLMHHSGLDLEVEHLPTSEEIQTRYASHKPLTRAELAVLLAYSKLDLYHQVLNSTLVEEAFFIALYETYFPALIRSQAIGELLGHPLRREITATVASNLVVNLVGMTAVGEVAQLQGVPHFEAAKAHLAAVEILGVRALMDALTGTSEAKISHRVEWMHGVAQSVSRCSRQILRSLGGGFDAGEAIARFQPLAEALAISLSEALDHKSLRSYERRVGEEVAKGLPYSLARRLAALEYLPLVVPLSSIENSTVELGVVQVAAIYFAVGAESHLSRLSERLVQASFAGRWEEEARGMLVADLEEIQGRIAHRIIVDLALQEPRSTSDAIAAVAKWGRGVAGVFERMRGAISQVSSERNASIAQFLVVLRQLRDL